MGAVVRVLVVDSVDTRVRGYDGKGEVRREAGGMMAAGVVCARAWSWVSRASHVARG